MTRDWTQEYNNIKGDEPDVYVELKKENDRLKELLKECEGLFNRSTVDGEEPNNAELIMILTKIEKALGED